MFTRRLSLLLTAFLLPGALRAQAAQTLTIAAASDLRFALDEVLQGFRATRPGLRVDVVYGSTGKLATQIKQGAPFDLFFAADRAVAQDLHASGHAATLAQTYAVGRLALWSTDATLGKLSLDEVVRHAAVKRFAIANPEHAPYGQRAREALRARGLWDAVAPKLVLGDNVSQAAQFVDSGAAQAGIVAYALVLAPTLVGKGAWTLLPAAWHSPLEQAFVITRHGAASGAAAEFVRHLALPNSQTVMKRFGFDVAAKP